MAKVVNLGQFGPPRESIIAPIARGAEQGMGRYHEALRDAKTREHQSAEADKSREHQSKEKALDRQSKERQHINSMKLELAEYEDKKDKQSREFVMDDLVKFSALYHSKSGPEQEALLDSDIGKSISSQVKNYLPQWFDKEKGTPTILSEDQVLKHGMVKTKEGILQKVAQQGIESLSAGEKQVLELLQDENLAAQVATMIERDPMLMNATKEEKQKAFISLMATVKKGTLLGGSANKFKDAEMDVDSYISQALRGN